MSEEEIERVKLTYDNSDIFYAIVRSCDGQLCIVDVPDGEESIEYSFLIRNPPLPEVGDEVLLGFFRAKGSDGRVWNSFQVFILTDEDFEEDNPEVTAGADEEK